MILRRVIEHFKKQEWTAIAIDFLIVVMGVFIGLQVSNWNEARIERAQERDLLIRLHEDMAESASGQERDLRFFERQIADQAIILAALDACRVAPDDDIAFQRGITTLGYLNPPRLYRRTIDEIAASGRTDIIRNASLAAELARIVALVEWRTWGFDQTNEIIAPYRYEVEHRVRHDLGRSIPDDFIPNHRAGVIYDIDALCKEPRVASAVSAVSYLTNERLTAFRPLLADYQAFLPLIEMELEKRWGVHLNAEDRP